ncbi:MULTISPECIES: phosphate acetyltransferase [unclassified Sporosarcina]|uniref:phosphate acetyltransferase n=1 Tax=unclassified Sporosarcina TaxID=2647733 RepID=UPI000C163648|nr:MULTISPECIES: phosphate acetyltransferase [unclassified Sporosarcina]PIC98042.1 phosphate acetyltransferase [Sporosarcina sp. P29]PID05317.1 phosphate acetyltransferase [Sporosarcina sp. P30]PID08435.1 phosphate acetyltransferase [Sporosarcina sp. P31]PID12237.1 phosphate acetyltransferase [Sporosarcina sp. P32b]
MADLFEGIRKTLEGKGKTIVLPEGEDVRILEAAVHLQQEGIITPVLLGNEEAVNKAAKDGGFDISEIKLIDPANASYFEELAEKFVERRAGKATIEQAREQLKDVNYFGTMLIYTGRVDGLVSGAAHSTADTVRPALQIIKTKPGISKTSGAFIMMKEEERLIFADCAITVNPSAKELAEIAVESTKTAKAFGIDPRVAMLSFSTKGSAVTEETEKVVEAARIAKELAPELLIDGEFQFDAAYVPSVAAKKAPESVIKGDANVFIFPTLDAGNIGYKLTERLGGYEAIGPILQGLNGPVNDLSRGCSAEDVYKLSIITAAQSL